MSHRLLWQPSYKTITVNSRHSQQPPLNCVFPRVLSEVRCFSFSTLSHFFDIVKKHTVSHHALADDNQLCKVSTLDEIHKSIEKKKNTHTSLPSVIHIGDANVPFCVLCEKPWCYPGFKSLQVTRHKQHLQNCIHTNQAHQFYTASSNHSSNSTLVGSLVLSRLDHCNSLLSGCPPYLLNKLQKVQNATARLVCKVNKSDHIKPILQSLH